MGKYIFSEGSMPLYQLVCYFHHPGEEADYIGELVYCGA